MYKFVVVMHLTERPERPALVGLPARTHIRTVLVKAKNYAKAVAKAKVGEDCEKLEVYPLMEDL